MSTNPARDLPTIGFIGLGVMGKPMASRIMVAGYPLTVHSRSPKPVMELVREGATPGASPGDVAALADVVITMLPDTPDVESVLLGDDGVLSHGHRGQIVVDMSTIDPKAARSFHARLLGRGMSFMDAPVSGGERGAIAGTLAIMVGGQRNVFEVVEPIFRCLGEPFLIGDVGAGQVAKACNQLIVGSTIEAVAEAIELARRAGVSAARVRKAMLSGLASSQILEVHGARMLERNFAPGFRSRLHQKDGRIVLSLAKDVGLRLPGFEATAKQLDALIGSDMGDLDHSALIEMLREDGTDTTRMPTAQHSASARTAPHIHR